MHSLDFDNSKYFLIEKYELSALCLNCNSVNSLYLEIINIYLHSMSRHEHKYLPTTHYNFAITYILLSNIVLHCVFRKEFKTHNL